MDEGRAGKVKDVSAGDADRHPTTSSKRLNVEKKNHKLETLAVVTVRKL